jgi:hypothetical protein
MLLLSNTLHQRSMPRPSPSPRKRRNRAGKTNLAVSTNVAHGQPWAFLYSVPAGALRLHDA